MDYLVQFQLNFYSLIVLVILYVTMISRSRVNHIGKSLYQGAILLAGIAIIAEPLSWIFDGKFFFGAYYLEYFTNFLLVIIAPLICGLMVSYVDYFIFKDKKRLYKRFFYLWPSIITLVFLIINFFYPVYFSVNKLNNSYSTGNLFWIQFVLVGLYYIYMLSFSVINRKRTCRYAITIFLVFFSFPFIGMIAQLFMPQFFFSWTSIVLSLLVIYIFLESTSSEKDYLTKLYSRQSYEKYVIRMINEEKPFSILFIDLDKLKKINDDLGHFVGDIVLVEFGQILVKVFNPNHMVSRLAGDEFTIVVENVIDVDEVINEVYDNLKMHKNKAVKTLQFSYGYQTYKKNMNIDELYITVDKKMYEHKQKKQ